MVIKRVPLHVKDSTTVTTHPGVLRIHPPCLRENEREAISHRHFKVPAVMVSSFFIIYINVVLENGEM